MFRQFTCRLAAVLALTGLMSEVRAQGDVPLPMGAPGDEVENCGCDCCQVTPGTGAAPWSCTASTPQIGGVGDAGTCPQSCKIEDPLKATVVVPDGGSLQYSRYCHMTCLPDKAHGPESGSPCRSLKADELAQLLTQGGNGVDPATLFAPKPDKPPAELEDPDAPPEPPQLADAEAEEEAADKEAADAAAKTGAAAGAASKEDEEKDKETGAMVAEAAGKQAVAAGIEARLTEAEARSAQSLSMANADMEGAKSNSLMVQAAQAQVKAAEVRAAIYAKSAAMAAKRAEAELKEIQDIPKKAAALAAAEAKKEVQAEVNEAASNVAIVKARLAGPGLPVPLAEAAVRAAQPYYNVMNKAIAMGNLYEANAHNLQDQAQELQQQSRQTASQAVTYQAAGYGDMAAQLMNQAKGMLSQSQAKDAAARKDFAMAEGVRKQVPNYQANAAAASARATSIANPAGQPPPAMAPKFLQLSQMTLQAA